MGLYMFARNFSYDSFDMAVDFLCCVVWDDGLWGERGVRRERRLLYCRIMSMGTITPSTPHSKGMLPKALKHPPTHQNTLYTTPLIDLFISLSLSLSFITLPPGEVREKTYLDSDDMTK